MPVLNITYTGQSQAADGSTVDLPPPTVLAEGGPVVQVIISVHQSMAREIIQRGETLPQPVSGLALIDTGASVTCIDEAIAQQLHLPIVNTGQFATATDPAVQRNIYPARVEIMGTATAIDALVAGCAPATVQGQDDVMLLIGRDILRGFVFYYNGMTGQITLSI